MVGVHHLEDMVVEGGYLTIYQLASPVGDSIGDRIRVLLDLLSRYLNLDMVDS